MIFKLLTQFVLATTVLQLFPYDMGVVEQMAVDPGETNRQEIIFEHALSFDGPFLPAASYITMPPVRVNTHSLGVVTSAVSALVIDRETGAVLYEKNADEPRSIGSITKLMTAYLFLQTNPDLSAMASIQSQDLRYGGIQHIQINDEVLVRDLLSASLVGSDNSATAALARLSGLAFGDFIARMNEVAAEIGMQQTTFVDVTGLSSGNRSVVSDVALMLDNVLEIAEIQEITQLASVSFEGMSGRQYTIGSTDELLLSYLNQEPYKILGGKTGYLPEAGYCLGTIFSQDQKNEIISVVLGSETKDGRFQDVKALAAWTYEVFDWK